MSDKTIYESENEYGEKTIIKRQNYGISVEQDGPGGRETVRFHTTDDADALAALRDEIDDAIPDDAGDDDTDLGELFG